MSGPPGEGIRRGPHGAAEREGRPRGEALPVAGAHCSRKKSSGLVCFLPVFPVHISGLLFPTLHAFLFFTNGGGTSNSIMYPPFVVLLTDELKGKKPAPDRRIFPQVWESLGTAGMRARAERPATGWLATRCAAAGGAVAKGGGRVVMRAAELQWSLGSGRRNFKVLSVREFSLQRQSVVPTPVSPSSCRV